MFTHKGYKQKRRNIALPFRNFRVFKDGAVKFRCTVYTLLLRLVV